MHSQSRPATQQDFFLSDDEPVDPNAKYLQDSSSTESVASDVPTGAAREKMVKLALKIYDTTPGINECKWT